MKFLCLSLAAIALALGACERHSWEDVKDEDGNVVQKGTKNLYKPHGEEGDDHGDKDHAKDGADHHGGGDKDGHDGDAKKAPVPHDHDHDGDGKADHD